MGKSCISNETSVKAFSEAPKCPKNCVVEASKLFSTAALQKHDYHRPGIKAVRRTGTMKGVSFGDFLRGGSGRGGIPHPGDRYNVCPQWCLDTRTVTRVRHHILC